MSSFPAYSEGMQVFQLKYCLANGAVFSYSVGICCGSGRTGKYRDVTASALDAVMHASSDRP